MTLEPLPESRAALTSLSRLSDDDLLADFMRQAELVTANVPSCVGLSLSMLDRGLTFTLVATSEQITALDGVQYAVGGPCVDAVLDEQPMSTGDDANGLLDEDRWASFARVGAAHGVLSTLSMPIYRDGGLVFGVNIYDGTTDGMLGHEAWLAELFGAWAPGATRNADLSFATREQARRTPQRMQEQETIDQATGVVVAMRGVDADAARRILSDAAQQAGVEELAVARALLRGHEHNPI